MIPMTAFVAPRDDADPRSSLSRSAASRSVPSSGPGGLLLDRSTYALLIGEERRQLTLMEWKFLSALNARALGTVLDREWIEEHLHSALSDARSYSALTSLVKRLRKKLVGSGVEIKARNGFGYALERG